MREIRTSGAVGGGAGNSTGPSYPNRMWPAPVNARKHETFREPGL